MAAIREKNDDVAGPGKAKSKPKKVPGSSPSASKPGQVALLTARHGREDATHCFAGITAETLCSERGTGQTPEAVNKRLVQKSTETDSAVSHGTLIKCPALTISSRVFQTAFGISCCASQVDACWPRFCASQSLSLLLCPTCTSTRSLCVLFTPESLERLAPVALP